MGDAFFDSPKTVLLLSGAYLLIVLLIGPAFMSNRKPFNVKPFARVYNVFQVIANIILANSILYVIPALDFSWFCQPPSFPTTWAGNLFLLVIKCCFWVRVADFLDTLIFVLAKKQGHVSFLHVYHHFVVVVVGWVVVRQGWGNLLTFSMTLNIHVHILMYSYYFLSTFPSLRPYLMWKKYLTSLQIAQFTADIVHLSYVALNNNCGYSFAVVAFFMFQMCMFLALFSAFYMSTYMCKTTKTQ